VLHFLEKKGWMIMVLSWPTKKTDGPKAIKATSFTILVIAKRFTFLECTWVHPRQHDFPKKNQSSEIWGPSPMNQQALPHLVLQTWHHDLDLGHSLHTQGDQTPPYTLPVLQAVPVLYNKIESI
jgi:hypothetical protein